MKKKSCFDCLHCKISASSSRNGRLCFCAAARVREDDLDKFWLKKPLCVKFEDMTEYTTSMVIIPTIAVNRSPLLRNRIYNYV
jgi:hypothetical protein